MHVAGLRAISLVAVRPRVGGLAQTLAIFAADPMASAITWARLRSTRRPNPHLALEVRLGRGHLSALAPSRFFLGLALAMFRAPKRA